MYTERFFWLIMPFYYFLFFPILLFVTCYAGIIFLSQGNDKNDYKIHFWRLLQPCVILALLLYYADNSLLGSVILLTMVLGSVIAFTFPALYYFTHHGEPDEFSFPVDFSYGLFSITLLISFEIIFYSFLSPRLSAILLTSIETALLIPCIFQIAYFAYYHECIDEMAIKALLETDELEAKEYIHLIPKLTLFFVIAVLIITIFCIYTVNLPSKPFTGIRLYLPILVACISLFLLFGNKSKALFPRTGFTLRFFRMRKHIENLQSSKQLNVDYLHNLTITSPINNVNWGTIILVIGESANRLHMKAFSDYERETTPWLSRQAQTSNFYLFPNSYSSWIQTPEAVRFALTNKNQYNHIQPKEEISVIDIANKLGFKTWWYSAQGYSESKSTDVTVIASDAKEKRWFMQDYSTSQYDEKLLDYLKNITVTQNNFVVLHLLGSHARFSQRYPASFEKWPVKKDDLFGDNPFDNSILYTDYVLSQIFSYATEHLNLQAMVYFSDHGSLVGEKRKSSFSGFEDTRIPFFVYLFDSYQKRFPQTAKILREHKYDYFTNDLIFDLICGLLQTDNFPSDKRFDISSEKYQFTKETLRTNLGKTSLSEDTYKVPDIV